MQRSHYDEQRCDLKRETEGEERLDAKTQDEEFYEFILLMNDMDERKARQDFREYERCIDLFESKMFGDHYNFRGCCLTCDKSEKKQGCLCYDCRCRKCVWLEDGIRKCLMKRR